MFCLLKFDLRDAIAAFPHANVVYACVECDEKKHRQPGRDMSKIRRSLAFQQR